MTSFFAWVGRTLIRRQQSLQHRFIVGVLAPPFFVLLLLGAVIIWQLNGLVRNQAIDGLNRAAGTTAAKLEREFALRETILKRTGEELFVTKSQYQAKLTMLESDRTICSAHVERTRNFEVSPNDSCEPFMAEFAKSGINQLAVEKGYVSAGQELEDTQKLQINERLTSFGQFFPETVALIVSDSDGKIISSALNEVFKGSTQVFALELKDAKSKKIEGKMLTSADYRLAVFSYPLTNGSVLAAYDLTNDNFLRETWESTPIDRGKALSVILDENGNVAYPGAALGQTFTQANQTLRNEQFTTLEFGDVVHIATGSELADSKWQVVVASPRTQVLAPVRDAQIVAVVIIGILLVGLLWVGTYFIQRTLQSILRLVSGSLVFASGNLNYHIRLDQADEEFVALANTMNEMAARIAAAEKEIDEKNKEFISIATHELRTPLTAIKGNLSMAYEDMNEQLSESLKPLIEQAYLGTTRLATLVNDMLDMARLDGNRVEFVIEQQDIKSMVNDVVETLRITANEKPVSLEYDPANATPVQADSSKLRIVLNNFVSNAIKYNRPNGSVKLYHEIKDNRLVTMITDTGLGIPDDQKAHMFEKFFRVQHVDRKDIVGTGLGMYITREYIIKMGGEVWFESSHGQGTTFCFSLPLSPNIPTSAGI